MSQYEKPPPYSPEAPVIEQPMGYQGPAPDAYNANLPPPPPPGQYSATGVPQPPGPYTVTGALPPPGAYTASMASPPGAYNVTIAPPAGYQVVPPSALPNYGSTVYVKPVPPVTEIVVVGTCPACRVGVLEEDFTCLGVCLAVFFFPLGILCCLAMRHQRCPNCGAIYG